MRGNVDARPQLLGLDGQPLQASTEGLVADRRAVWARLHPPLGDYAGDPDVGLDPDKLDSTEAGVVLRAVLVPGTVDRLRLRPALRDGEDEALAPADEVVADLGDELVPLGLRPGGIALG